MYVFNTCCAEDQEVILPRGTTVLISRVWGYDLSQFPSDMFDVSLRLDNPVTVSEATYKLAAKYAEICKEKGLTPREAYGYEGIRRLYEDTVIRNSPTMRFGVREKAVEILLGT